MRGKPAGRNESERPMRHRESDPGGRSWESWEREGRACVQVAKADTEAGKCNRGNERLSLSGVKAVARRERAVGKRTRASYVLQVAGGKRDYKGQPEMNLSAWLAVGGAHSSKDEPDSITGSERRRSTSGDVPGVGGTA